MVAYALELYLPGADARALDDLVRLVQQACRELRSGRERIRYLNALLLPDDETAFLLFEATTPDALRHIVGRAGLRGERLHPAVVPSEQQA